MNGKKNTTADSLNCITTLNPLPLWINFWQPQHFLQHNEKILFHIHSFTLSCIYFLSVKGKSCLNAAICTRRARFFPCVNGLWEKLCLGVYWKFALYTNQKFECFFPLSLSCSLPFNCSLWRKNEKTCFSSRTWERKSFSFLTILQYHDCLLRVESFL